MIKKNKDRYVIEDDDYAMELYYEYFYESETWEDPENEELQIDKVHLQSKLTRQDGEFEWVRTDITDFYFQQLDTEAIEDQILQKERDNE